MKIKFSDATIIVADKPNVPHVVKFFISGVRDDETSGFRQELEVQFSNIWTAREFFDGINYNYLKLVDKL